MTRVLTLMGSGETSPTMVKTHRALLARVGATAPAVLLDTPFGFQSNADDLTARAQHYFEESVGRRLEVATFRSIEDIGTVRYEQALDLLRAGGYVFAGPGSPTYALRQWRSSLVPALLEEKVTTGSGCVTFASAAALTLGAFTVPVYEIYKVGADPAWEEGLDILGTATGLRAAVIPHFNNAEGGTHDTRFCYLGETRLSQMERSLPEDAFVLGIDEHTGLVIDLDAGTATVVGNATVTLRWPGLVPQVLSSGTTCSIDDLAKRPDERVREQVREAGRGPNRPDGPQPAVAESPLAGFVREAVARFDAALESNEIDAAVQAVLDLETELERWADETFSADEMGAARGALRAMIVRLGTAAAGGPRDPRALVGPFVDLLLDLRRAAREDKRYDDADSVRDALGEIGVEVRDTPAGPSWELKDG